MKRFQNNIASSRWSLPLTALAVMAIWILAALRTDSLWLSFAAMVASSYLMVELNNANALIRIYSRMVSCSFMTLTTITMYEFASWEPAAVTLCMAGFYTFAFRCYQDGKAPGLIFYAFVCLSLASLAWVQVFFFLPLLWIVMAVNLMAMSARTFSASLLGIILPYWFYAAWCAATGNMQLFVDHFTAIAEFHRIADISNITIPQAASVVFIFILALIGMVHFLHTSYNDKIRTRMLYEIFITIDIAAFLFLVLQPQHLQPLLGIIIVNTAPLIGHFVALTHTKFTNITFIVALVLAVALFIYNQWMHLQIFF